MPNILIEHKGLLAALAFAGYLGSCAIVWGSREETVFSLTVDRGCIQTKHDVPALRFDWMKGGGLQPLLTAFYWPVNALCFARSDGR